MECLDNLVGIKELCTASSVMPYFWLDDAEGLDRLALAQISKPSNGSGLKTGQDILSAAQRFLLADVESLIPKGYSIKGSLNSFCNTCTYTALSSTQSYTGIIVKNISISKNAYLSIDSLKIMIGLSGTFTVVLEDGIDPAGPKLIEATFTAGVEKIIQNINFKTLSKSVKIYFLENAVPVRALSCPVSKNCGCSSRKSDNSSDIQVKGLLDNSEFTTQYGFIPCASVVCSMDNVLCNIVNQQPRLFALALFYRSAATYFNEFRTTQRNNRNASFNEEEKTVLADRYMDLYYERLRGSGNVKGISDNMTAVLNSINDPCIECIRPTSTAWAIG